MFFSSKKSFALAAALVITAALLGAEQIPARAPRVVMNIVNFVRSLDPRHPRSWHGEVLREEVALNLKYKFKNTILFQYDALIDPELRAEGATLRSDYAPAFRKTINLHDGHLLFTFQDFRYKVRYAADVSPTGSGFIFRPHAGAIRFDLSLPDT